MKRVQGIRIARKFMEKVVGKYSKLVKCVVMMGSVAKNEPRPKSDIDVFIVFDDTIKPIDAEEKRKIDEELGEIAMTISERLSVQPTYLLTEWWEYVRICHPIIYNFIKEGVAVYDVGFFGPIKRLLEAGRLPATREGIERYMEGAPKRLQRAEAVKLLIVAEDAYYAMLNSIQAALMYVGIPPPPPANVYREMRKNLVEPKLLEPEYAEMIREIIEIRKKIEDKELLDVTGEFVDECISRAKRFVNRMFELLGVLEVLKRTEVLKNTHRVMYKAATQALGAINKMPKEEKDLPHLFKKEFVDSQLIDSSYWNVWNRVEELKRIADKQGLEGFVDIDEDEVYRLREHLRYFIRALAKILKDKEK